MPSPRAVLLTPPKSSALTQLPSCQQSAPINPLDATPTDSLASAANKRLTPNLSPVDATLTKKRGVGCPPTSALPLCSPRLCVGSRLPRFNSRTQPQDEPTFLSHPSNDQNLSRSFFSITYKLPIFYPLSFHIHPCNGGVYPPPNVSTAFRDLPASSCEVCSTPNVQTCERSNVPTVFPCPPPPPSQYARLILRTKMNRGS